MRDEQQFDVGKVLGGDAGHFVFALPIVLTASLVASRVVSMTFIPLLGFYLLRRSKRPDVSMAEMGRRTFNITEQNIRYPKDLTLQDLSPSTLKLSVRRAATTDQTNRG